MRKKEMHIIGVMINGNKLMIHIIMEGEGLLVFLL